MPPGADPEGSEDVNDFLQRIKELGEQRDREDEERTRKLEEEIIQGRKERQARRAERARSLSPTKDANTHSNTPGSEPSNQDSSMPDILSKTPSLPRPSATQISSMDSTQAKSAFPVSNFKTQESLVPSPVLQRPHLNTEDDNSTTSSSARAPPRSNPLSWQQRPSSRESGSGSLRSHPPSALTSKNVTSESPKPESEAVVREDESSVSKSQIAQSLGSKDPTFFRQTQDRGLGSAAYRKNQVEDTVSFVPTGRSMKLPGMSRDTLIEPEARASSPPSRASNTPFTSNSVRGSTDTSDQSRDSTSVSLEDSSTSSLPSSHSQRFAPSQSDTMPGFRSDETSSTRRGLAMSPSQGRLSPEHRDRPASPTKGLGGFVQSAMMKRSDSVNKRWSAQAGPGLSRGNSVTSAVGAHDGVRFPIGGVTPITNSRQSSTRETTPSVSSRPSSSQSNLRTLQSSLEHENSTVAAASAVNKQGELPGKTSESTSNAERVSTPPPENSAGGESVTSPLASPSKRWSPTKSSWLGNAISKPESPKILSPATSQQPAWMADLNRNKKQRGSVDIGKSPGYDKVAIGGFVRSPPLGIGHTSPSFGGASSGSNPDLTSKSRTNSLETEQRTSSEQLPRPSNEFAKSSAMQTTAGSLGKAPKSPPSLTKTKPDTPPKKDFRSSLKSQQTSTESKGKGEPEFKNVFGKLKKTQTQNYVAPDELKDNIMRGKTGLAKTGGPQKSVIRDEFKESILKKKEGMNMPTASTKISSASSKIPDTSTPEAIAKRRGLGSSESNASNKSDGNLDIRKPPPKPEALSRLQTLQEKSRPGSSSSTSTADLRDPEKPKPGLGGGFASSLAGILQKGPPTQTGSMASRSQVSLNDGTSAKSASSMADSGSGPMSGPELTHATKGRARGPKRKLPSAVSRESTTTSDVADIESQPALALIGDKASVPMTPSGELKTEKMDSKPLAIISENKSDIGKSSQPDKSLQSPSSTERIFSSTKSPLVVAPISPSKSLAHPSLVKLTNPEMGGQKMPKSNDPNIKKFHELSEKPENQDSTRKALHVSDDGVLVENGGRQESSPTLPSVKSMAGVWSKSPESSQPSQPKTPIKLPTRVDEEAAMADAGLRPSQVVGLGIEVEPQATQSAQAVAAVLPIKSPRSPFHPDKKPTKPQQKSEEPVTPSTKVPTIQAAEKSAERVFEPLSTNVPRSPPTPGRKPTTIDGRINTAPLPASSLPKRMTSPSKEPSESAMLFSNIFEELPSKSKVNVDTQAILDQSSTREPEKIKTLRKQILEITDNGKSLPVPSDQEHILFEDSLYLCTHVFGTSSGARKSEVYLWCGDGVSPSSVEDAQLFARKMAKDNGGKLVLLRQGKESSNFFQALGGIVITRRGSSNRSDSATYMLCGRRHLGQIAFDEVDFHPQSLCTGFPYIISARGGRLYLWKGNGASADELGCARLIGMDLGLTGEIEEIDAGKEPSEFWSSFSTSTNRPAATPSQGKIWHLKPACEKYGTKLFEIDVEYSRPKSSSGFMSWGRRGSAVANDTSSVLEAKVKEVTPYSQADLVEDGVFVLDAFFEVFVICRLRTSLYPAPQHRSTRSSCLRAALLFAQEYGILAASIEDRPCVPHSSVVILSKSDESPQATAVPEGIRSCFRKWTEEGIATENVQILALAEALEA